MRLSKRSYTTASACAGFPALAQVPAVRVLHAPDDVVLRDFLAGPLVGSKGVDACLPCSTSQQAGDPVRAPHPEDPQEAVGSRPLLP